MPNVIFLTGIHGVGKNYVTNLLKQNGINLPVYVASQLLKQQNVIIRDDKKTDNIANNQELLIQAIANLTEETIILDGHVCLINRNGEIEAIPIEFLEKINMIGIILLTDCAETIRDRLHERDNNPIDLSKIKKLQQTEIKSAHELAQKRNIPIEQFDGNYDIMHLINFINSLNPESRSI